MFTFRPLLQFPFLAKSGTKVLDASGALLLRIVPTLRFRSSNSTKKEPRVRLFLTVETAQLTLHILKGND